VTAGRLGGDVSLLAMCGTDSFADLLKAEFEREPVRTQWIAQSGSSQHSFVIVSKATGLRTTIWTPQPRANATLISRVDEILSGADVVLLDCTDEVLTRVAVDRARNQGVPIVMDTGSYKPWSEPLLYGIDYLIAPEKFVVAQQPAAGTPDEAHRLAYEQFTPLVFGVTQGDRGGRYLDAQGAHQYDAVAVHAVDTCGAGDTFHGAFALAIALGKNVPGAFDIAAWAASRKCATLGNAGLPTADDLALMTSL